LPWSVLQKQAPNWYHEFLGRPLMKIKRLIIIEFARMLGKAVKFRQSPVAEKDNLIEWYIYK
jgi:hypothetical protein